MNQPIEQNHQGAINNQVRANMIGGNDEQASFDASTMGSTSGSGTGTGNGAFLADTNDVKPSVPLHSELNEVINGEKSSTMPLVDLLPDKSQNKDDWFDTSVQPDFDETYDYMIGIDTVGQSLKNASHDIRGTVPCPKINGVSPWGNSSIEPDYNITGLGC